jgi:preprotein translocase subunit SecD
LTAACVAGLCLAWLSSAEVSAQQAPTNFDQPDIQGNALRPSDLAKPEARRVFLELRLAEAVPVRGLTFEATVKNTGKKLFLHYTTVVSNGDVSRARVVESAGKYEVAIRLTDDGAVKMASATARHTGRPVAIILDGNVVADVTIREALRNEFVFSANFTQAEAARIVDGLNRW